MLLKANALVDKNPAFTAKQLKALVTPDVFEVIDWPGIFGVASTPLKEAFEITFRDPVYSKVALDLKQRFVGRYRYHGILTTTIRWFPLSSSITFSNCTRWLWSRFSHQWRTTSSGSSTAILRPGFSRSSFRT